MSSSLDYRPPAEAAAYGGPQWAARDASLAEELGDVWAHCGLDSEYGALESVLLHRPGAELLDVEDPDAHLFLSTPDARRAAQQHDALAEAYREQGVQVTYLEPVPLSDVAAVEHADERSALRRSGRRGPAPSPNQMYCADLFAMTPSGAIVGRPASTVRAGEERRVARRLAELGVPILRSVAGRGTFEGADLCWLEPGVAMIGQGLRTNAEGAAQVSATLREIGAETVIVHLPHTSMHLMEELRFADRDLAFGRAGRIPWTALDALGKHGYEVRFFPDDREMALGYAHNVVTLGPRRLLAPAGCPHTLRAYEGAGVTCVVVALDEIHKCAGGIGCLTGVLARERTS